MEEPRVNEDEESTKVCYVYDKLNFILLKS